MDRLTKHILNKSHKSLTVNYISSIEEKTKIS